MMLMHLHKLLMPWEVFVIGILRVRVNLLFYGCVSLLNGIAQIVFLIADLH